jgi:transposase
MYIVHKKKQIADGYKQIITRNAIPSGRRLIGKPFIFQQDNDPKHTARIVKNYLARKTADGTLKLLDWPSQSPDLNPIEHVWKLMKDEVRKLKPTNLNDLFEKLETVWRNIPIDYLQRLIDSMPQRCQAVIDANGMHTKY